MSKKQEFRSIQDNDGHWYRIPSDMSEKFNEWMEIEDPDYSDKTAGKNRKKEIKRWYEMYKLFTPMMTGNRID